MPALPRRALLVAALSLASLGTIAAVVPDRAEPRSELGMEDTAAPRRQTVELPDIVDDVAVPGEASVPGPAPTRAEATTKATTAPAGPSATSVVLDPTTTTSTTAGPSGPSGPTPLTDLSGRIVFSYHQPTIDAVWSMRPDGSDAQVLDLPGATRSALAGNLDVSPDGRTIARSLGGRPSADTPDGRYGVVVQDVATRTSRTVLTVGSMDGIWVRFSPDGRRLAVSGFMGNDNVIKVITLANGSVRTLETGTLFTRLLSWSPDGQQLLAESLHLIDVSSGAITDLDALLPTPDGATDRYAMSARWSPNGDIVFTDFVGRPGSFTMTMSRLDLHTSLVHPIRDSGNASVPVDFLADGRILVPGYSSLEILQPSGATITNLTLPAGASWFTTARG